LKEYPKNDDVKDEAERARHVLRHVRKISVGPS